MAPAQQTFPIAAAPSPPRNGTPRPAGLTVPVSVPAPAQSGPPAPPVEQPSTAEPAPAAPTRKAPAKKAPAPKTAAKKAPARPRKATPAAPAKRSGEDQGVTVAAYTVLLAAALMSVTHIYEVADLAGQEWRAFLLPLSVDGLASVSWMTLRRCRRLGVEADRLVTFAFVLSVAASFAANVIASDHTLVDPTALRLVVAGWPPAAFLLAELVLNQWHALPAGPARRPGAVEPLETKAAAKAT